MEIASQKKEMFFLCSNKRKVAKGTSSYFIIQERMTSSKELYDNAMQYATVATAKIEQQPTLQSRANAAAHLIDCDNYREARWQQGEMYGRLINTDCSRAKQMLLNHLAKAFQK